MYVRNVTSSTSSNVTSIESTITANCVYNGDAIYTRTDVSVTVSKSTVSLYSANGSSGVIKSDVKTTVTAVFNT